ncbi:MAG: hypothetical protein RI947_983 [Candidatus Parcubacteria bacterium]|jgi:methionyl-tRNA synthetase
MKKTNITYDDFAKLDIRVGEVKNAVPVEKSEKLLNLTVDLGADYGEVTILTGMAQYHHPEAFIGKKFCFVANLEPRKMMGLFSNGMLMSADEEGKPLLIEVSASVPNGLVVR